MLFNRVKYLILVSWCLCCNCEVYSDRPSIKTSGGDLTLKPGRNKNIYLTSNGPDSGIFINDVNFMSLNQTKIKITAKEDLTEILKNISSVENRILRLENLIFEPNTYINSTVYQKNLYDINDRLVTLERKVLRENKETCSTNPCFHGGTCLELISRRHCLCPTNWEGDDCSEDVNECRNFAGSDLGCQNGATCLNVPGSYQCLCQSGWYGVHCTRKTIDCSGNNFEICGYGTCVTYNNGVKCICDQGWTTDGSKPACLTDVDECNSIFGPRCSANPKVSCINLPGSFSCGPCPSGYEGNGYVCYDIDECTTLPNGGCSLSPKVSCHNTVGSRICGPCPHGYEGDGVVCTWKGPCNINNGNCHPSAQCINTLLGGSQCICPDGMEGNGIGVTGCYMSGNANTTRHCENRPCGIHGVCHLVHTGYTCICYRGYTGPNCETRLNYCENNPCANGGTCISDTSKVKGFRCECTSQFSGDLCKAHSKTCGGFLDAEEGSIAYPNTNHSYNHNSRCAWVIHTSVDKVINVTFTKFNLENDSECSYDFLQIHDGRTSAAQLIDRFCGNQFPRGGNIISSHNYLYFWFRSDATVAKDGFALHWKSIKPVCGGELLATAHGQISSPGSPGRYPPNRDCYWHLSTSLGKRIQIHFFALDIEIHKNCSYDYIAIYDGSTISDPLLSKFCNSSLPPPIHSAGSDLLIHFHSDPYGSGKGFQLTFAPMEGIPGCGGYYTENKGEISSPSYDGKYLNNIVCEYKIKTASSTTIKLNFQYFAIESSFTCRFDYLKIYDGPSADSRLVGKYCGINIPQTYTSSSNSLYFVFVSDNSVSSKGFKIKYRALCQQTFVGESGILKSPGYPFMYPSNKVCEYLIVTNPGKAIQLTFQDIDIEDNRFFKCEYDNVEVRDGPNENSTLLGKFCGSTPPPVQISTHNYMYIKFSTDLSVTGTGFYANYTTFDRACGGIYKNTTGIISYPPDEGSYGNNQKCIWVLQAPVGMAIKLTWNRFSLEHHFLCSNDYLEMFEVDYRNSNNSLGKFCGSKAPPSLTTTYSEIILKFESDINVVGLGFSVNYTFVNQKTQCGGTYISTHGQLNPPGWPNSYQPNRDCKWIIQVPAGQQIRLNITNFDLERPIGQTCHYGDYLEIRNGARGSSPLIGKFCGTLKKRIFTSMTNSLFLRFHSDSTLNGEGFNIEWDSMVTGCGGTLTSSSGSLTSPNYPENYDENAECFFKIIVNPGLKIKLNFTDIELEEADNCKDDYVEIFDGRDETALSMGKYCKSSWVPSKKIETSSNYAYIKFRSDILIGGRGFWLDYESICNTNLTGSYGVIESPDYPNNYKRGLNCLWTINVPKGNKINITFTHFDIFKPDFHFRPYHISPTRRVMSSNMLCSIDYLQMKETSDKNYSIRFCGNALPATISSKTESYQIQFKTGAYTTHKGFRLEWVRSGCGGYIKRSFGNLNFENIDSKKQVECEWIIETQFGRSIKITFTGLYLQNSPNCTIDAIEIYNGEKDNSPRLSRFCHSGTTQFSSTSNKILVKLIKHSSLKDAYFTSSFSSRPADCGAFVQSISGTIHSKEYPKNYDDNLDCVWKLQVNPNHRIELKFEDLDLYYDGENDCNDHIRVYDEKKVWPIICGKSNLTSIVSRNEKLEVQFISDQFGNAKGFKANFFMVCGAVIVAQSEGTIESDNFVNHSNKSCVWTIKAPNPVQKIYLTITYMSIPKSHDSIISNRSCPIAFLKVFDGVGVDGPLISEYCGRKVPPQIASKGSAITLELGTHVSGLPKGQFSVHYTTLSTACGGMLTSEEGYIASPNFPLSYPAGIDCEWTLRTSVGNKVYVVFENFDLENSDYCNEDYLEMRESNSTGHVIGIYCGNKIPSNTTIESKLYLKFHSNGKVPGDGFLLRYGFLHGNEIFVSYNGEIASPMYPHKFDGTGEYFWRLLTNGTYKIDIKVLQLEIPSFDSSCYNSLIIYDGFDEDAPILEKSCGVVSAIQSYRSTSNVLFVKLKLDKTNTGSVFLLSYMKTNTIETGSEESKYNCGYNETRKILPGQSIDFSTPNYPENYNNLLKCQWVFSTTPGQHLNLRFLNIQLEETPSCFADYIKVFATYIDDPINWISVEDKFCLSDKINKDIGSTKIQYLRITFNSDTSIVNRGFIAQVKSLCGGYLNELSGVFGPIWSQSVRSGMNCEWTVKVRPGRMIKLHFEYFNISNTDKCDTFVVIKNGDSANAPMLSEGKYCGYQHENRSDLVTSSNALFVSYTTRYSFNSFRIRYEEQDIECGLTSILDSEHTSEIIKSPNYPFVPLPYSECVWVFTGPPGEILKIEFIDRFDIEYDQDCTKEAIEIKDGSSSFYPSIGQYCGEKPGTIKTSSNHVYIKYFTQLKDPRNGFSANVSIDVCGGTIKADSGEIKSPGYPHIRYSFPFNTICEWKVIGPIGHVLKFNLKDINLQNIQTSCGSNVTIEESTPATNNTLMVLETFCGSRHDFSTIETTSNEATIKLFVKKERPINLPYQEKPTGFWFTFSSTRPQCGGIITTPEGFLTTPGYPRETSIRFCQWSIIVPNKSRRIRLEIIDANDQKQRLGLFQGFSMVSNLNSFNMVANKSFESTGNKLTIFVFTNTLVMQHRFKAKFSSDEPALCGGELDSTEGELISPTLKVYTCEWNLNIQPTMEKISNYTYGTILMSVAVNSSVSRQRCRYFDSKIAFKSEINSSSSHFTRHACGNNNFTYRFPAVNVNMVATKVKTVSFNFHLNWKLQPCGGIINIGEEPVNILENIPEAHNDSLDCAWLIVNNNRLEFHLEGTFQFDCDNEFVLIQSVSEAFDTIIGNYCKDKIGETIITVRTGTVLVQFHSKPKNATKVKLIVKTTTSQCGGILKRYNSYFTSPNYPKSYSDNQECTWTLQTDVGFRISLQFIERFVIEYSQNCTKDAVIIYDWKEEDWVEIGRICGRDLPPIFNSTQTKMKVVFRTDSSTSLDGFKAKWISECGGTFIATNSEQILYSPGYPSFYFPHLNCMYEIKNLQEKQKVELRFIDFQIEGPYPDCKYDNVTLTSETIFGGGSETFCGKQSVKSFKLRNPIITFKTDRLIQKRGFKISYVIYNCGGFINAPTEIVGNPDLYDFDKNCTWFIEAPKNKIVIVHILYYFLESNIDCNAEYLSSYDGLMVDENKKLGTLCGYSNTSSTFESTNNTMTLNYFSGSLEQNHGFKAQIVFSYSESVGCGGQIILPPSSTKILKSPLLPGALIYENFLHCHWKVLAPPEQTIKIEFTSFHIAPCQNLNQSSLSRCDCDSVEIRDGINPTSYLIGSFCGHSLPPQLTTSSNQLSIRFLTDGEITSSGFELKLSSFPSLCGQTRIEVSKSLQKISSPGFGSENNIPRGIHCMYHLIIPDYETMHLRIKQIDLRPGFPEPAKCNKDKLLITFNRYNRNATYGKDLILDGHTDSSIFLNSFLAFTEISNIPETLKYCGHKKSIDLYLSSSATLSLQTDAETDSSNHKGVDIDVIKVSKCGWNRTDYQGRIYVTKNYDDDDNKNHCAILITAPENNTISIHFLLILPDLWNNNVYLDVIDGNTTSSSKLIRISDEYDDNIPLFSTGRYILLYSSIIGNDAVTFDLNYLTTDKGRGCGGSLNNLIGKISSPLYPDVYRHKGSCVWQLETPHTTRLRIHFLVFDLGVLCDQNYLQVLDREGSVISTHCSEMPADFTLQDNYAKIVFTTTMNNGGTGWVLEFAGVS